MKTVKILCERVVYYEAEVDLENDVYELLEKSIKDNPQQAHSIVNNYMNDSDAIDSENFKDITLEVTK